MGSGSAGGGVGGFNPAALHGLGVALADDSEVVEVDADELRRVGTADVRRRCGALKLAARIVGMATADSVALDDAEVLQSMGDILRRLASVRQMALKGVGADREAPDFPSVFNAVTGACLDLVTEEWKFARLADSRVRPLPPPVLVKLLDASFKAQPERFDVGEPVVFDVPLLRRICVLEAIPRLWGLANLFDYYQEDRAAMVGRLLRCVVEQAELYASQLLDRSSPPIVERSALQRMYGISVGLLCEVYKANAYRDVTRLRELPELDRSIRIAQYERHGGMDYAHVIEAFRDSMTRMMATADVILESQRKGE